MSRRVGALLAAVGLAAALLGGCGIPDRTDVRVDGPGPRPGAGVRQRLLNGWERGGACGPDPTQPFPLLLLLLRHGRRRGACGTPMVMSGRAG